MKKTVRILLIMAFVIQAFVCTALAKSPKEDKNEGFTIAAENISVKNGTYSFSFTLRSDKTLSFDNSLQISYNGVDGRYSLSYEIDKTDNHIMTVKGSFDNIIVTSPLWERLPEDLANRLLAKISEDTYFYQLNLRTKEGFSFKNGLKFLFGSKKCGYSLNFNYSLADGGYIKLLGRKIRLF